MPNYKVRLRYRSCFDVTVEADDEKGAIEAARDEDLATLIMANLDEDDAESFLITEGE